MLHMFKGKIDIKIIFIFVLATLLIISFIFRPSKPIDGYEDRINQLKEQNDSLLSNNNSLKLENSKLDVEIQKLLKDIDSTQAKLDETNNRIISLENGKNKVSDNVNKLNADGIANSLSDYLNRSEK